MSTYLPRVRKFFAGAGLLIFGLHLFEEAIKSLGGRKLKRLLEQQTKTTLKAIRAGTWISGLTTSSTFVSLLLVAFVGGGLLSLYHAIPVLIGANIGTTLNSLRVAYVGFGNFKIAKLAFPLLACGGIIYMTTKNDRWLDIANMAIGLGLLFVGLDYMKGSVEVIATSISLDGYHNLFVYGLLGFSLTALLHSQAAMSLITLSALSAGMISITPAFAIIIGANVGTTMTALVASLSGSRAHKQVARGHVLQNVFAALLGIIFFQQFVRFCNERLAHKLGYYGNHVLATAWFNTVFNIATAIPFIFLISPFSRLLETLIHNKNTDTYHFLVDKFRGIGPVQMTIGIQLDSLQKDMEHLEHLLTLYLLSLIQKASTADGIVDHTYDIDKQNELYHTVKDTVDYLYTFHLNLQKSSLTTHDVEKSKRIDYKLYRYIEVAKAYKSIAQNLSELSTGLHESSQILYVAIVQHVMLLQEFSVGQANISQLQQCFMATIQEVALNNNKDIDIATLINTQQIILDTFNKWKELQSVGTNTHLQN